MSKSLATATYRTIYAGAVTIRLMPVKTTRRGERVTRYRWMADNGMDHPRYVSPFATVEGAIAAARRNAEISDIVTGQ